eukprot:3384700-Pyramimonas_sp.AAC.1
MADCVRDVRTALEAEGLTATLVAHDGRSLTALLAGTAVHATSLADIAYADDGTVVVMMPACD